MDIPAIQSALRDEGLRGWLLADFRGTNALAARLAGTAGQHRTRRWYYWIPASGEPAKLVHRIEAGALDHLPGGKTEYLAWPQLHAGLKALVGGPGRVAMEYSPLNNNPYVGRVDAGTVELVRSFGPEVVSSGDLVQHFEATWTPAQWQQHLRADAVTTAAFGVAWGFIAEQIRRHGATDELAVQRRILDHFAEHKVVTDSAPIVAEGDHGADPHFAPAAATNRPIRPGSFVLLDLWAKLDEPGAVYSDLTRVGYVGETVPTEIDGVFQVVRRARDAAIERVRSAFAAGARLEGWQVDDAARRVIADAGHGDDFVHRTGHSIGEETHGNGAHMDGLEMREDRRVMPNTCFSVEPGIYLPGRFGVRSEVNVFVDAAGAVHVTGGPVQTEVERVRV